MGSRRIMEGTVNPIITYVQNTQASAFADLRADRTDNLVNTNPFVEFLTYEKAIGYRTPCLFVIGRSVDFRKSNGQNFIDALVTIQVSALIDDKDAQNLTLKAWRYHDALHEMLDRAEIPDDFVSNKFKVMNKVKVTRSDFGELVQLKSQIDSPFRKEVMLTLEVEHYEQE